MAIEDEKNLFKMLIRDLNDTLLMNGETGDQKTQVEKLMGLEKEFKKAIWAYPVQSRQSYKKFMDKIMKINKNVLSSRPFFREKSPRFNSEISGAIKSGKPGTLRKFNINFNLISFIRESWIGTFPEECEALFIQTKRARDDLIEANIPLAINRAKIFYKKVPESHITLDDMIGIASVGLVAGIDKFVGEYSKVFRSVAIGYMTRDLMDNYSRTLIYFYPSDKQLLYRANTIRNRMGIEEPKDLARAVTLSLKEDLKNGKKPVKSEIDACGLLSLVSASRPISDHTSQQGEDEHEFSVYDYHFQEPLDKNEEALSDRQAMVTMLRCIKELDIVEQKVIKLKGKKI